MEKGKFVELMNNIINQKTGQLGFSNKKHDENEIVDAVSMRIGIKYQQEQGMMEDKVILIRRILDKSGDLILDALDESLSSPRVFYVSKIKEIRDITTGKLYSDPKDFLVRHISIEGRSKENASAINPVFKELISKIRHEVTALVYMANIDGDYSESEKDMIQTYVRERCPDIPYDESKLRSYLDKLCPDELSFLDALEHIAGENPVIIKTFLEKFVKTVFADGEVNPKERLLLKELISYFKEEGINISISI